MMLSKDAILVSGITLLLVPTIMYGGWLIYLGAFAMLVALVITAIGLLRNLRVSPPTGASSE